LASDVTETNRAATMSQQRDEREQRVEREPEPNLRPYRTRFVFVYVALAVILAAGAAGAVVVLSRTTQGGSQQAWSSWKPAASDDQNRVREIADHVSRAYRLPNGDQLLNVILKPPKVQNVPIRAVAVLGSGGSVNHVDTIDSSNSMIFQLCGLGQTCAIAPGKPTIERGRFVRREALELALYTFKYAPGITHVIAFMPPRTQTPELVLYFTPSDVRGELAEPLNKTLSARTPRQNTITARETATIDRLTEPRVYKFALQRAQLGDAVLVLKAAL
jgi:hypothetical protein